MMSALLLGILGVPDEVIVEDCELSNKYLADHYAKTYAFLEEQGVDVELIRPLTEQHASNLQPALEVVHDEYGGWDAFATEKLGLDQATLDALRQKLLASRLAPGATPPNSSTNSSWGQLLGGRAGS